jgi:hypothetical protein
MSPRLNKINFLILALGVISLLFFAIPQAKANCGWVLNNSCSDLGEGFAEKTGSETSLCDGTPTVNGSTKKCCCGPDTKGCCLKLQDGNTTTDDLTLEQCRTIDYATTTFFPGKEAKGNKCDALSGETSEGPPEPSPIKSPILQVSIPGFGKFSNVTCDDPEQPCQFPWIAEYIEAIYNYGLGIIGILSVIVMMIGGVIRLTAAGNNQQVSRGNSYIKNAILGLVFTFCSYSILYLVNPNLTIFKPIGISYIDPILLEEIKDADNNHDLAAEPLNMSSNGPIGASGVTCKESERIDVPSDVNGLGILDQSGQKACPDAINSLKKAAQCMKGKNPNYIIRISSASRTLEKQKIEYAKDAKNACNPYNGNCPHMSGVAFDAWGCTKGEGGSCKHANIQSILQDCMKQSGLCILSSECWHFENPQFSRACGTTKNYNGKYCSSLCLEAGGQWNSGTRRCSL